MKVKNALTAAWGQYFNNEGLLTFWNSLLLNREYFKPDLRAQSVADIDYQKLHN